MRETREMICIACPVGCRLTVKQDDASNVTVENFGCKRGITYGTQEFTQPMRTVTSSVLVDMGARPLCAVKTKTTVPKEAIPAVLDVIRTAKASAPILIGQVVVPNIAGTGVDLVATASCERR